MLGKDLAGITEPSGSRSFPGLAERSQQESVEASQPGAC